MNIALSLSTKVGLIIDMGINGVASIARYVPLVQKLMVVIYLIKVKHISKDSSLRYA